MKPMPAHLVAEINRIKRATLSTSALKRKKKRKPGARREKKKPEIRAKEFSIRSTDTAQQVIYGRFRVGGVISFVNDNAGKLSLEFLDFAGINPSARLHLVTTIAGHEIDGVEEMYVDNEKVTFGASPDPRWSVDGPPRTRSRNFGGQIFMAVNNGSEDQAAQPDLVAQSIANFPASGFKWTPLHRQRGCAHVYNILIGHQSTFPNGLPDLSWLVRGKKVLDPRDNQWKWTQNAALIVADYLSNEHFGVGIPWHHIDIGSLIIAANTCDELIPVPGQPGGVEARYHLNGAFDTSMTHEDVLEEMLAAMAGDIVVQGGQYRIIAGKAEPPAMSLNEDDFRGPISVQLGNGRRDLFNGIKGKYISPVTYEAVDFAPVKSDYHKGLDGETRWEDITLNFVTQHGQARRVSKIELERNRQSITVQARFSLKCYYLQVGDWITLNFARYGWENKFFEVAEVALVFEDGEGVVVELTLEETSPLIYFLPPDADPPIDIAPNTFLGSPYDAPEPSGVKLSSGSDELYIRADGTVYTRIKVSWELPEDFGGAGGEVEIQYSGAGLNEWTWSSRVPAFMDFAYISDVRDGALYDVRIRSVNGLGAPSEWVYVHGHSVLGKREPPSDVANFTAQLDATGVVFNWTPVPDLDLSHYVIKQGSQWASATFVSEVRGTSHRISSKRSGGYSYLIKAVDTSRNESLNSTALTLDVLAPEAPVVTWGLEGTDVILRWTQPLSVFGVESYDIYFARVDEENNPDPTFANDAILITSTKALSHRIKASWGGKRIFWICAKDNAGNPGKEGRVEVSVQPPGPVRAVRSDVIDNNVLLYWSISAQGTLPVATYRIYKGAAWPHAVSIVGEVSGTFQPLFESSAGRYTYWIVAVDSAGNQGTPTSITTEVNEPPDFQLRSNDAFNPKAATKLDNIYIEGVGFLYPQGNDDPDQPNTNTGGRPVGLLLALTQSGTTPQPPHNAGQPLGLLLALTKSSVTPPPQKKGVAQGLLLSITREE